MGMIMCAERSADQGSSSKDKMNDHTTIPAFILT